MDPAVPIGAPTLWYKDAVIYELHVRAYADSDGDGIGDFRGLAGKLDYLRDLGVTALWLLPFYPSPLRDDGYDISDYRSVHPIYGTLDDFRLFLEGAHRRGLRVITELVLNHTSDRHPWFQLSRRAPRGDPWRDYYVWSDTPKRYQDARVIFKDFEHSNWSWDPVAGAYYWHRFYAHQPDLNWDNPAVRQAMFDVVDFWLDMGVDGLRLDAVPYLFEREGTSCENLPETHAALKALRAHVDEKFSDRMLLAEANQWPEDAVSYFGAGPAGDECHMAFHFPLMPRMFMAVQTEDRFPIVDILEQTPALPEAGQWALFLRNHDELTLEMVTDEERDYMYRMYADDPQARINLGIRRRLAPLLSNNRRKIELMTGLLFSLPGTPVLYYGDEIGMGDNFFLGDRNGVRTPMQWSADRNAGFSPANSQRLFLPVIIDPEYHYEAYNVDVQENNPQSLLWWMKRLIALRKRSRVFGRGALRVLPTENRKVLAFLRQLDDEQVLVVANLSRFVQPIELRLPELAGHTPVEMLGKTDFPPIGPADYPLTLGPHAFYWFDVQPPGRAARAAQLVRRLEPLTAAGAWTEALEGEGRVALAEAVGDWLRRTGAAETRGWLRSPRIAESFPFGEARLLVLTADTATDSRRRSYLVPAAFASGERAQELARRAPDAVIAPMTVGGEQGLLVHAAFDRGFCEALLSCAAQGARLQGRSGAAAGHSPESARAALQPPAPGVEPSASWDRLGHVLVTFGPCAIKLFQTLEDGVSPELELGRFLTEQARFASMPPLIGALEYLTPRREPATLAVVQAAPGGESTAWSHTLDALAAFFEKALSLSEGAQTVPLPKPSWHLLDEPTPALAYELIGPYLREVELLARRTAELHKALSSPAAAVDANFAPEPFTWHYQRSLYQSMRTLTREASSALRARLAELHGTARREAENLLQVEDEALQLYHAIHERKISAWRIRCHGDYHLGRVVYTGKDFLITGFEGDLPRPLSERRMKRSPLWDVACMLRSFHYAAYAALFDREIGPLVRPEDIARLEDWARYWQVWVGAVFFKEYLAAVKGTMLVPGVPEELEILLTALLRERALRELQRELGQSTEKALLPLKGLSRLLKAVLAR